VVFLQEDVDAMTAPTAPTPPPLLDLDTLLVRLSVRIDGVPYEIRNRDELSVLGLRRVNLWCERFNQILVLEAPTAEQEAESAALLQKICQAVLDAPPDVHAKLQEQHRMAIADVFCTLRASRLQTAGATATTEPPPTGASSPPASPGSTEGP